MNETIAGIAAKARELVASNLTSLVESATNPEKMLRLLRSEIEENIIGLQDTLTKANRRYGRLEGELPKLEAAAKDWTAKAKLAMDKGREDLARGALLAREAAQAEVRQAKEALSALAAEAGDAEAAIAQLEGKLSELRQQIAKFAGSGDAYGQGAGAGGVTRRLDRIGELERRVANSASRGGLSPAELDRQLRELERDERIDAELEKLKAGSAKKK